MSITSEIINRFWYFFMVMRGNLSGVPVNFLHFWKMWYFWLIFAKYLATCKNAKCPYLTVWVYNVSQTVVCVLILYKMTIPITINIITTKQRPEMGNLGKTGRFGPQSDPKTPKMMYYNSAAETPLKWCKPYINAFLRTVGTFWNYFHATISKYYEVRAQKSAFWPAKWTKM